MYVTSESGLSQTSCVSGIWRRSLQKPKSTHQTQGQRTEPGQTERLAMLEGETRKDDGPGIEEVDR